MKISQLWFKPAPPSELTDRSNTNTNTEIFSRTTSEVRVERRSHLLTLHQLARDGLDKSLRHKIQTLSADKTSKQVVHLLNELDEDDLTALHLACRFGREGAVSVLVHAGANLNDRRNENALAPIHLATKNNHAGVVTLLIALGADPNIEDAGKFTPLHWAISKGHKSCAVVLLNHSLTQVNARDNEGITPFHVACMNGNAELGLLLLQHDADLTTTSENGENCLHFCAEAMRSERVVILILEHATKTAQKSISAMELTTTKNALQNTPLHIAVMHNHLRLAQLFLETGCDVNAPGNQMQTPLHMAAFRGSAEMIDLLMTFNADLHATDEFMDTPLHLTCLAPKNLGVTRQLIEKYGADVEAINEDRRTPLSTAASKGLRKHVAYLLSQGASATHADEDDQTPLHSAAFGNHFLTARLLLGIVPQLPELFDADGTTPIAWTPLFSKPAYHSRRSAADTLCNIPSQVTNLYTVDQGSKSFSCTHIAHLTGLAKTTSLNAPRAKDVDELASKQLEPPQPQTIASADSKTAGAGILSDVAVGPLRANDEIPCVVFAHEPVVAWGITWVGSFQILWERGNNTITKPKRILLPGIGSYDPAGSRPFLTDVDMRCLLPFTLCIVCAACLGANEDQLTSLAQRMMQTLGVAQGRRVLMEWMLRQVVCSLILDCDCVQYPDFVAEMQFGTEDDELVGLEKPHTKKFLRVWRKQKHQKNGERTILPPKEFFLAANVHSFPHVRVDTIDNVGNSALHHAAEQGHSLMCQLLLERGANIELTNDYDETPLHLACANGFILVVRVLIDSIYGSNAGDMSDSESDAGTDTSAVGTSGGGKGTGSLVMLLALEDDHGCTPLHVACKHGHDNIAAFLLDIGADLSKRDLNGRTPLHLAAKHGHQAVVRLLLNMEAPLDAPDKFKHTPLQLAAAHNHVDVLWQLLDEGADLLAVNQDGLNALDLAINQSCTAVVFSMTSRLPDDDFFAVMQNHSTDANRMSVMGRMVCKLPRAAILALDRCISTAGTIDSENYRVTFRFDFVDSPLPPNKNKLDNTTLELMVQYQRKDVMNHEAIQQLISSKWKRFGRWLFFLNLLQYLVFVVCLTTYMLSPGVPDFVQPSFPTRSWGFPDKYAAVSGTIVMIISVVRLAKEGVEFWAQGVRYFRDETNVLDVFIFCSALVLTSSNALDPTQPKDKALWDLYVATLFFSLVNLILFVRRIAAIGIFVFMFRVVLTTFVKVLAMIALLTASFSLAFFVALQNANSNFRNLGDSILKVLVMFVVGEYQFEDVFEIPKIADKLQGCPTDNCSVFGSMSNPDVAKFLMAAFLVLMPLLLTNLLIGLAVGDIAVVQEQAKLTSCTIQTHLITDIERSMGQTLFDQFEVFKPLMHVFPNKKRSTANFIRCLCRPFQTDRRLGIKKLKTAVEAESEFLQNGFAQLQTGVEKMEVSAKRCLETYEATTKALQLACDKVGGFRSQDEFD